MDPQSAEPARSWALVHGVCAVLASPYAPDEKSAEAAAVAEFKIADERRTVIETLRADRFEN